MSRSSSGRALLLVDHGSRRPEANQVLEALAEGVRARRPGAWVATAHLELAQPLVPEAIDALVASGAREIVLQPCFLAPGRHGGEDIARLAGEASARHPEVAFRAGAALGAHPGLVDALLERADAARASDSDAAD